MFAAVSAPVDLVLVSLECVADGAAHDVVRSVGSVVLCRVWGSPVTQVVKLR